MKCIIGFGIWNKNYLFLIGSILIKFLTDGILGIQLKVETFYRIFLIHHPLIILFLNYLSQIVLSLVFKIIIKEDKTINQIYTIRKIDRNNIIKIIMNIFID